MTHSSMLIRLNCMQQQAEELCESSELNQPLLQKQISQYFLFAPIFCSSLLDRKKRRIPFVCFVAYKTPTKLWLDRLVYGTIILLALDMSLEESLLFFERGAQLAFATLEKRGEKRVGIVSSYVTSMSNNFGARGCRISHGRGLLCKEEASSAPVAFS